MKLLDLIRNIIPTLLNFRNKPWWIKITTEQPQCIYYFGPFENEQEAQNYCPGYIEDIKSEQSQGIKVAIKPCNPELLTIDIQDDLVFSQSLAVSKLN
ncbi:MAG TPA: DUF1816 domain-containing protein [Oculatellaceae cyanobacterium]|jgi:hypothetical protein